MRFVVFRSSLPVRVGNCPADRIEQQAEEGEIAKEAPEGNPKHWRLVDGAIVTAQA